MSRFLIGADPEVFVGDPIPRSIIGKIGGSKDNPLPLPLGKGFSVQEDNVALEFNIPPASSREEFIESIARATGFLEHIVKDQYGYSFLRESAISFSEEELNNPLAFVFGCDPDFNCWTNRRNPHPRSEDRNLRSAGGHVHIGVKKLPITEIIKGCDLVLGVPSNIMDSSGARRRALYGKAGAYRKKAYGCEYRTLSNYWIFSKELTGWIHDGVARVLDMVENKHDFDEDKELILSSINKNDFKATQQLIEKHNLVVL